MGEMDYVYKGTTYDHTGMRSETLDITFVSTRWETARGSTYFYGTDQHGREWNCVYKTDAKSDAERD